jgi:hypothetical protein
VDHERERRGAVQVREDVVDQRLLLEVRSEGV